MERVPTGALVGRAAAAVGIVCALVAIWLELLSVGEESYWDDGTTGAFLLILSIAAALLLVLAFGGSDGAELGAGGVGAVLWGFYLFLPAAFAFDNWDLVGAGGWLGVCAGLIPLGIALSHWTRRRAALRETRARRPDRSPAAFAGPVAALVGIGLVLPGIWLDAEEDGSSYWSLEGLGHSLGIYFLVLTILCLLFVLGTLAVHRQLAVDVVAAALALLILGTGALAPVSEAFGDLGNLRAGAWLVLFGGLLLAAGTISGVAGARKLPPTTAASASPAETAGAPPPASG